LIGEPFAGGARNGSAGSRYIVHAELFTVRVAKIEFRDVAV
jgi:hypothetical protein